MMYDDDELCVLYAEYVEFDGDPDEGPGFNNDDRWEYDTYGQAA